jgi:hypothetical protein
LLQSGKSPDTYNTRLKIFNVVVTLITVLMPAIDWVLFNNRKMRSYTIVGLSENISLVISCCILVWGFKRLIKVMKLTTVDTLVDKTIITWHIIAYFFVVVANLVQYFVYFKYPKFYAISTYCLLAINLVCSTILAVIVNTIVTKHLKTKLLSDSITESVMTASIESQQNKIHD